MAFIGTNKPLDSSGKWTSGISLRGTHTYVRGTALSEESGTLYIEFSPDGINWDISTSISTGAGVGEEFSRLIPTPFWRLRFDGAEGDLRVQANTYRVEVESGGPGGPVDFTDLTGKIDPDAQIPDNTFVPDGDPRLESSAWTTLPALNGWADMSALDPSASPIQYYTRGDRLYMTGMAFSVPTATATSEVVCNIPLAFRPDFSIPFMEAADAEGNMVSVWVRSNGDIEVGNYDAMTAVALGAISWRFEP